MSRKNIFGNHYNKDKNDLSCVCDITSFQLKKPEDDIICSIHRKLKYLSIDYTFYSEMEQWHGTWNKQTFIIDLYYDKEKEISIIDLSTIKKKTQAFWDLFQHVKSIFI